MLLSMGKEHLYVWEMEPGMLHENDGAEALCALCFGENMARSEVKEGKIEITATCDGLFRVDTARLTAVNMIEELMIATRHSNTPVKAGDKLCGTRVIPLVIREEKLQAAREAAGDKPLLEVLPYRRKTVGVVTTGSEVFHGRIQDTFTPVIVDKLRAYGMEMTVHELSDDGMDNIVAAIEKVRKAGVDLPVSAGVMPIVNQRQIQRTVALSAASLPPKFTKMIARWQDDPASLYDAGIDYAIEQLRGLIQGGADGVHLYAMNNPEVARRVWQGIADLL